jgi:hypothetical protein
MRVLRLPTLAGFLLAACAAVHGAAPADPFAGGRWVDLTHDYAADTLYWPTADGFALEVEFKGSRRRAIFTPRTGSGPRSTAAPTSTRRSTSPAIAAPSTASRWTS